MATWTTPIIDRTQSDVDYAKYLSSIRYDNMTVSQKNEWNSGLKGCATYSARNRVENNIQIISDVMELGLTTYADIFVYVLDQAYFENILSNLTDILAYGLKYTDTPTVPSYPINHFSQWNDIEKILLDVYSLLSDNFYNYAGNEIFTGEEIGVL
jgi:hypothetical protein